MPVAPPPPHIPERDLKPPFRRRCRCRSRWSSRRACTTQSGSRFERPCKRLSSGSETGWTVHGAILPARLRLRERRVRSSLPAGSRAPLGTGQSPQVLLPGGWDILFGPGQACYPGAEESGRWMPGSRDTGKKWSEEMLRADRAPGPVPESLYFQRQAHSRQPSHPRIGESPRDALRGRGGPVQSVRATGSCPYQTGRVVSSMVSATSE